MTITTFKVTDFCTNRKRMYDFLLVINTLPPILHRFQVMADYWSNFRYQDGSASLYRSRWGDPLRNIAIKDISLKTRFCGLHFRCRKYWCIFNHFYVIRPEKLPNSVKLHGGKGYYAVQGHPRSPSLVPIESPYATSY